MAAYRRVYDSRHLQADCQEPGSAPEPYARQLSMGHLFNTRFLRPTRVSTQTASRSVCAILTVVPNADRQRDRLRYVATYICSSTACRAGDARDKQDPDAGNSRVAECRSQKIPKLDFEHLRSSERHVDSTVPMDSQRWKATAISNEECRRGVHLPSLGRIGG